MGPDTGRTQEADYARARLELWRAHLYAGQAAYVGVGVAMAIYVASTWSGAPNRGWIALVLLLAVLPTPASLIWARELVASRWRELAFIIWNMASYTMILIMSTLDGGITSPIALLWFLPTIYLLFGYSRRAISFCAPFGLALYLVSAALTPAPFPTLLFALQLILIADSLLLVWLGVASGERRDRELERLQARLQRLASTDDLTGCRNRGSFAAALEAAVRQAARTDEPLTLLAIDVDDFKQVNDEHGHPVGDDVLRHLGASLLAVLRDADIAGRLGGDEFAILCRGTGADEAVALARRLRRTLTATRTGLPAISISIGICALPPQGIGADELRMRADQALYAAKRAGVGRCTITTREGMRTVDLDAGTSAAPATRTTG